MSHHRARHGPPVSAVPNNLVPEVIRPEPIVDPANDNTFRDFDDSPVTHPDPRPDWAVALDNQALSLKTEIRDEMKSMEQRLYDGVANIIGQHYGGRDRPAEVVQGSQTMRTPKPLVANDTTDDEHEAGLNQRALRQHARHFGRQTHRPAGTDGFRNRENGEDHPRYLPMDVELYRRTLERIKSYVGPTFLLSRKKGKYADDWIRSFDNWFRAKVCDPNIDDSAILSCPSRCGAQGL
ncbi:hypothetical protein BGZ67_010687, partial [Mortierella alpina]